MTDLDRTAVQDALAAALAAGMPEQVAMGFVAAQFTADKWTEAREVLDRIGQQAHQGDPVKKARVDHFNDVLIAELKDAAIRKKRTP